jgi:membrane associated rhomboid family serine protease
MTKIVKNILLINVIAFIIQSTLDNVDPWFTSLALWPTNNDFSQTHQWVTHMFLHSNFMHILFNMLVFISFGPLVEKFLGSKRFIWFYLISGLFAAGLHTIITNPEIPMIGASGAVFGVLAASVIINSDQKVYLFFIPIGIKIKWVISVLLLFELYAGIFIDDNVGHFAHIGGALIGLSYLGYLKYIKNER